MIVFLPSFPPTLSIPKIRGSPLSPSACGISLWFRFFFLIYVTSEDYFLYQLCPQGDKRHPDVEACPLTSLTRSKVPPLLLPFSMSPEFIILVLAFHFFIRLLDIFCTPSLTPL